MNADKTIYGRFGTRSSRENAEQHMTSPGLEAALNGALAIHRDLENQRATLTKKQPVDSKFRSPDDYPSLAGKYTSDLAYQGAVTKSCLHCHQVRDAERQIYRDAGKPIPDQLLFPYPLPSTIGMKMDPNSKGRIKSVITGSAADDSGLKTDDEILTIDGQPILSIADIQWALHQAPDAGRLKVTVLRDARSLEKEIRLVNDWRSKNDISWRVTSWPLRRMGTGGLVFEPATSAQRNEADIPLDRMALRVKRVGQYGPHAAAKRAGVKIGDIMINYDDQSDNWTTSQLLGYIGKHTRPGRRVKIVTVRDGKQLKINLPMQK